MPQVPSSFVPSVAQTSSEVSPLASPGVAPGQNAAPEQLQKTGAAVTALGDSMDSIGLRIQAQMDDAQTKSAETQALKGAMDVLHNPQSGYLNLRGLDAVNGYDGATQGLQKSFSDAQATLSTPLQKRMFAQVASAHMLNLGTQMADHQFQQRTQYAAKAASDRAEVLSDQAIGAWSDYGKTNPDGTAAGDFDKYMQASHQEALSAVKQIYGAPEGSDIANKAILEQDTAISRGALMQMMDSRVGWQRVQSVYDDMQAKGYMNAPTLDTMGKMVKAYTEQEQTRTGVNNYLSDAQRAATGQQGGIQTLFPVKGATFADSPFDPKEGGVSITVPPNSAVQADADGTVISLGAEDGGAYSLKIQHRDGSVSTIAGLANANVKVGDQVQRGDAIASSGDSGKQKNPSVFYAMTDANGAVVDPTRAGVAPVDLTKITDEKVLDNALQGIRKDVTDPYLQQQMVGQAESMVRHNQAMENAAKTQTYRDATNYFYQAAQQANGITPSTWKAIPPSLFSQLTPEQRYDFQQAGRRAEGSGDSSGETPQSINARYWLVTHPFFTKQDVLGLGKDLTSSQFLEYTQQAEKRETSAEDTNAPVDKMQLETTLQQAGLQSLFQTAGQSVDQRATNQQRYLTIHNDVQDLFNAAQTANKRPLNPGERQKILSEYLINNQVAVHDPGWFTRNSDYSGDKTLRYENLTEDQLSKAYVTTTVNGNTQRTFLRDVPQDQLHTAMRFLAAHGAPATIQNAVWFLRNQQQQPKGQ